MFALPEQSPEQMLTDLQQAIDYQPEHISWYQLTLEPNTPFYQNPPPLPNDDQQIQFYELGSATSKATTINNTKPQHGQTTAKANIILTTGNLAITSASAQGLMENSPLRIKPSLAPENTAPPPPINAQEINPITKIHTLTNTSSSKKKTKPLNL